MSDRSMLIADIARIYDDPSGCCLHIVLDDGNLATLHVEFCMNEALDAEHVRCTRVARELLRMTEDERRELYETRPWETEP